MKITHKLIKKLSVLSARSGGSFELNIVAWNDRFPKYDLRIWSLDGKPGRGITMDKAELIALQKAIEAEIIRIEAIKEQKQK